MRAVFQLWACRPTETHPNKHWATSSLTRPAGRLRRDGEPGIAMPGAVLAGSTTVDQVGGTEHCGDSAGFGVEIVDSADHRGYRGVGAGHSDRGRTVRGAVASGQYHA